LGNVRNQSQGQQEKEDEDRDKSLALQDCFDVMKKWFYHKDTSYPDIEELIS
jgi:hypothetical protein